MRRLLLLSFGALVGCGESGSGPNEPVPADPVTSISAGGFHSCAVTSTGVPSCWGSNSFGRLGDGTSTASPTPVRVSSAGISFVSAHAGSFAHTCGVATNGDAYCWGRNDEGQLGNATTTSSTTPVRVQGLTNPFAVVSPGNSHTCGLLAGLSAGAAYCWGFNGSGAVGDGTTTTRTQPALVSSTYDFVAITAGVGHTCGIRAAGAACWGNNGDGQLGDNTTTTRTAPVAVTGGHVFAALSAGSGYTCGVTGAGAAYCWGSNSFGKLGDGSETNSMAPVAVSGPHAWAMIDAGSLHTCGITTGGTVYCWGSNVEGQLGNGTTISSATPVAISSGLSFATVRAGGEHTCAVTTAGAAYCWGSNGQGQLGDGTTTGSTVPVRVVDL